MHYDWWIHAHSRAPQTHTFIHTYIDTYTNIKCLWGAVHSIALLLCETNFLYLYFIIILGWPLVCDRDVGFLLHARVYASMFVCVHGNADARSNMSLVGALEPARIRNEPNIMGEWNIDEWNVATARSLFTHIIPSQRSLYFLYIMAMALFRFVRNRCVHIQWSSDSNGPHIQITVFSTYCWRFLMAIIGTEQLLLARYEMFLLVVRSRRRFALLCWLLRNNE